MKKKTNPLLTFLNAVLPPIIWAALIFFLSSQPVLPGIEVSSLDFVLKKVGHMVVYAVLYVLTYRGTMILFSPASHSKQTKQKQLLLLIVPIALCLVYAISDEIHQSFTPNRFPSGRDVGYDMFGVFVAYLKIHRYI